MNLWLFFHDIEHKTSTDFCTFMTIHGGGKPMHLQTLKQIQMNEQIAGAGPEGRVGREIEVVRCLQFPPATY
jgi:hypothetical protein